MMITFVVPAMGERHGRRQAGGLKLEPLAIAALQAVTPSGVETEFFDDRLQTIDYTTPTDLVAISVETCTARRAYAIADAFRGRGVPVVLGGYHVTLLPEEAIAHSDAVVLGDAESVWADVVSNAAAGRLRRSYRGGVCMAPPSPDRSIFRGKKYLPFGLVEAGRGCAGDCTFCSITQRSGGLHHKRPVADIAAEIAGSRRRYHLVLDDNLLTDRERTLKLCEQLARTGRVWGAEARLDVGRDTELLKWLKAAHCEMLLIDFDSLEPSPAELESRPWNAIAAERAELVRRIHRAGIGIHGSFTFGHDTDTRATFDRVLAFAETSRLFAASFTPVLPMPGTPVYDRLAAEGRLRYDKWWLAPQFRFGEVPFTPLRMRADEVATLTARIRRDFASPLTWVSRALASVRRHSEDGLSLFMKVNSLGLGEEPIVVVDADLGRASA